MAVRRSTSRSSSWFRGGASKLSSVMERCSADLVCHEAYPRLEQDMDRVMTRLSHSPVTTSVADASGRPVVVEAVALPARCTA